MDSALRIGYDELDKLIIDYQCVNLIAANYVSNVKDIVLNMEIC